MPIGFWAISRRDVETDLAYWKEQYTQPIPTTKEIDRVIKLLTDRLGEVYEDTMVDFARGELE